MPRRTAIGLDIGTSVVRAIELSYGRGGITLERFGQLVLPPGAVLDGQVVDTEAVAETLRTLWSATGYGHKRVVLGVANQRVIVRQLELPWLPRAELARAWPFQVHDLFPMPVDQAILDYFPPRSSPAPRAGARSRAVGRGGARTVLSNWPPPAGPAGRGGRPHAVRLVALRFEQTSAGRDRGPDRHRGPRHEHRRPQRGHAPVRAHPARRGPGRDRGRVRALGVPLDQAEVLKQQVGRRGAWTRGWRTSPAPCRPPRSFVTEVRGSLDYYAASHPASPSSGWSSPGAERLDGILDRLAAATRLPVVAGDPLGSLRVGQTGLEAPNSTSSPRWPPCRSASPWERSDDHLPRRRGHRRAARPCGDVRPRGVGDRCRASTCCRRRSRRAAGSPRSSACSPSPSQGRSRSASGAWPGRRPCRVRPGPARRRPGPGGTLRAQQATYAQVPQVLGLIDAAATAREQALGKDILWYGLLSDLSLTTPKGVKLDSLTVSLNTTGTPTPTTARWSPAASGRSTSPARPRTSPTSPPGSSRSPACTASTARRCRAPRASREPASSTSAPRSR